MSDPEHGGDHSEKIVADVAGAMGMEPAQVLQALDGMITGRINQALAELDLTGQLKAAVREGVAEAAKTQTGADAPASESAATAAQPAQPAQPVETAAYQQNGAGQPLAPGQQRIDKLLELACLWMFERVTKGAMAAPGGGEGLKGIISTAKGIGDLMNALMEPGLRLRGYGFADAMGVMSTMAKTGYPFDWDKMKKGEIPSNSLSLGDGKNEAVDVPFTTIDPEEEGRKLGRRIRFSVQDS